MSQVKGVIGTLAQNNYYLVNVPLSDALRTHFSTSYSDDPQLKEINKFMSRLGYLCSEATLPTSSYATAEVKDNFLGVTQEFAHTRLYTDIDLTFYVDDEYSILRFFEGWMDYIAGGNQVNVEPAAASYTSSSSGIPNGLSPNIYRRFNFPDDYKVQNMVIYKFERDFNKVLEYTFVNAFPKAVNPLPVAYGPADVLKVTVTFNFDRYLVRRSDLKKENIPPKIAEQLASLDPTEQLMLGFRQDFIVEINNSLGAAAAGQGQGLEELNRANAEAFARENNL